MDIVVAMLHMVMNTHEAADCPLRSEANRAAVTPKLAGLDEAAAAAGVTVEASWANMAGHTMFFLVEAPHSHAVDELFRAAGLAGFTTTRTFPVRTLRDLLDNLRAPDGSTEGG